MEEEITHLRESLQQANENKSKFISIVTHELRTPMTSNKGYTDLPRVEAVGPVNEGQQEFLNVIRNNIERMSALISDLADINRMESDRPLLEFNQVSVSDLFNQAADNLRPQLEVKRQTLETDVPPELPRAYADADRVGQMLTNLLDNASRYSAKGEKIHLPARAKKDKVRIEVLDNGNGISGEEQKLLFSQFFRFQDPAVREEAGWGLSLHVSKQLIERMGGEINLRSKLGEGSRFWITLPIREA
jgi:signal transduction histidine kinase